MFVSRRWNLIVYSIAAFSQIISQVSAQSRTSTSTSSRPTTGPRIHVVDVGNDSGHAFVPDVTRAAVGDIVQFHFWPNNHSVVRGVYTDSGDCGPSGCNPCTPWELIHPDQKNKAFTSGNILTSTSWTAGNESTVWNLTVTDESPLWFFCTAIASCNGGGMVGVINPSRGQSVEKQEITATRSRLQLTPGENWPFRGSIVGALDVSSNSASSSPSPSPSSSSSPTGTPSSHVHGLSGGAIAGIAVGAAVVVVLAAGLCYFVGRSNTYREVIKRHQSDGVPSQVGEIQSQKNQYVGGQQQHTPSTQHNWQDHRFSGQTAYSSPQVEGGSGTFVGYNRQTGAPEFATEAPVGGEKPKVPAAHPAFGTYSQQGTTYELPAGTIAPSTPSQHSPSQPPPSAIISPLSKH